MFYGFYYVFPTVLVLIVIRKYRESKWGRCKNDVKLNDKVAIVTGANSGIGLEIAKDLASRNAKVILACRTLERARQACEEIKEKVANSPQLIPMEINLESLRSVEKFAQEVKQAYPEIHLLINNAGVSYPKNRRVVTLDNIEIHFAVNHLAHFHLTNLLLEPLSRSSSRIIIVASSLHERGEINLDDLNNEKPKKNANLYANSKLANIYFARELATRVDETKVKVYACCPGWVYTGLFRHYLKWYHYVLISPLAFFFMRSAHLGAQTPLYCATEPSLEKETGQLYRDCKHFDSKAIFYDSVGKQLWEKSEEMIRNVLDKQK